MVPILSKNVSIYIGAHFWV